jgi:tripartite-type tricarboxylate transporter receptor subunit TctC
MPLARRRLGMALLAAPFVRDAAAQAPRGWAPSRTVSLVVPFAAGGSTDAMARLIAVPMGQRLGQSVVVENVTGASGNIGAARVARAAPDGHTLLMAHVGVLSINQHLFNSMPFDAQRDLTPVGLVCTNPMTLLVSARSNIPDVATLAARARRGELRVATSGVGSTLHIGALQALGAMGGRADLIPYRGGAPAVNDLLAGTVDMLIEQAVSGIPNHQGGRARALFVTGPSRLPAIPEVPTAAEAGLPSVDFVVWNALLLPREAPAEIVAAFNAALDTALADATVRSRLEAASAVLPPPPERGPEMLARLIARDGERWGKLLRDAGVEKEG